MVAIAEFMAEHHHAKPLVIVDTLGKIRRPKQRGEDSYQVDYEMGATLKALADARADAQAERACPR